MYKVGDKVRIRSDLKPENLEGNVGWGYNMPEEIGKVGIINSKYKRFFGDSDNHPFGYTLQFSDGNTSYNYCCKHLEPISLIEFKFIYEI